MNGLHKEKKYETNKFPYNYIDLKITYKPLPSDDPTQRRPDITLAKTKLGWEPKIKLSDGLDKTIEYFDKKLKG